MVLRPLACFMSFPALLLSAPLVRNSPTLTGCGKSLALCLRFARLCVNSRLSAARLLRHFGPKPLPCGPSLSLLLSLLLNLLLNLLLKLRRLPMLHKSRIPLWFQKFLGGRIKAPQDLWAAVRSDDPVSEDRFFRVPDKGNTWDIPKRLCEPIYYFTSEPVLAQHERADWQYCDQRLMHWAALFIEYARKYQIPLYVHSATRSEAQQSALVAAKRSKAPYPTSAHNIGEAVDIVHSRHHWEMSPDEWKFLHVLGLRALDRVNSTLKKADKLDLEWGGDWRFYDPAHWQIRDYKQRVRRLPLSSAPLRMTPRRILSLRK